MATVTGYTAAKMAQIEAGTISDARIDGSDLILIKTDLSEINVGNVQGIQGIQGPIGEISQAQLDAAIAGITIDGGDIPNNSITELKLANDAVTSAKIAPSAVGSGEIANDAVTSAHIGASQVDATAIAADAVVNAKIANGAVTSSKLGSNSVSNTALQTDSVNEDSIENNVIDYDHFNTTIKRGPWVALGLDTGWTGLAGYATPSWRAHPILDIVEFKGSVKASINRAGGSSYSIDTMPAGYRPPARVNLSCYLHRSVTNIGIYAARIDITTGGVMTYWCQEGANASENDYIQLDGLFYHIG